MRSTDNRYRGERRRFELAMRMIAHEARTGTIRHCTGLSEDRIRKLYATYFKHARTANVRRHRGKSPRQIAPFVASLERRLEASAVAALLVASGLLSDPLLEGRFEPLPLDIGARFCRAFETYHLVVPKPSLSFEWTWNLYQSLVLGEELALATCGRCGALPVRCAGSGAAGLPRLRSTRRRILTVESLTRLNLILAVQKPVVTFNCRADRAHDRPGDAGLRWRCRS